jgi:hypothetical protein
MEGSAQLTWSTSKGIEELKTAHSNKIAYYEMLHGASELGRGGGVSCEQRNEPSVSIKGRVFLD